MGRSLATLDFWELMMVQMCPSEMQNLIFNMEKKVVLLDLLVVSGFCSRDLFNIKVTQASPDLG